MKVKFTTNINKELLQLIKIKAIEEGINVNEIIEEQLKNYLKEETEMEKYFINFNTGTENEVADTLEDAMTMAVEGATYTQESITITLDGEIVATLPWYGVEPDEDDIVTVAFGDYGFYGEWQEY